MRKPFCWDFRQPAPKRLRKKGWLLAEMAAFDFPRAKKLLKTGKLDLFVHNKTISKIRDSCRISREQKAALRRLRRKE